MSRFSSPPDWKSLFSGERPRRRVVRRDERGHRPLQVQSLESREMLSAIPIAVNVPDDIQVSYVYLEVSAVLEAPYMTKAGHTLPTNSVVYYDAAIDDYALAEAGGNFSFQLATNGEIVELPDTNVTGGHIAIGIGSPPNVEYTSKGISTPTAATNPRNVFGLFEYAITSSGLDIDLSEIDQVGFPFTITTTPAAAVPANDGVGITPARQTMFDLYTSFITEQGSSAALFQQSLTAGDTFRILAPQNIITGAASAPKLNPANYLTGGSLTLNTNYYYWITATNASGETGPSNTILAVPYNLSYRSINYPQQTVVLDWGDFADATGYNVYRSIANDPKTGHLIGSTTGSVTTFKDTGLPLQAAVPPTNSYTYNALNSYFNNAIDDFFSHYTAKDSFVIDRDGYTFAGEVAPYKEADQVYDVLTLSTTTGPYANQEFRIFRPYFSNNTNIPRSPAAPTWMPHADQSPAAMILAADGVFNTGGAQPGVDAGVLSDLENSIVSAFNRGIANNFAIAPNNWASEPELNSATPRQHGANNLAPTNVYFYMITATNADGETTVSLERTARTTTTEKAIELEWSAHVTPTHYNIYRKDTPSGDYQLLTTVPNSTPPTMSFIDDGSHTPTTQTPPTYYAPNSISNWYSAFWHQNSSTDPVSGVSINGLAYGFPYDDQGSQSTNFQGFFNRVDINIGRWGSS
jgi:hypothetical protein